MSGDPYFASVVSLLHFDGADASTTITDVKGKVWTASGNAQLDTAQSKFGGASGLFDGTGDYFSTPGSVDFDFGAGDFTIEAWVRTAAAVAATRIIFNVAGASGNRSYVFGVTATNKLYFGYSINGVNFVDLTSADNAIPVSAFAHIAVTRSGTGITGWVDGYSVFSATLVGSIFSTGTAQPAQVGGRSSDTQWFDGHLDDLRITKGYARYTAAFTPPTVASPDTDIVPSTTGVVSLMHFDGTSGSQVLTDVIGKQWGVFGNAQLSSTQSKFGGVSGYFDSAGDYIACASPDFGFGAGDWTWEGWVRPDAVTTEVTWNPSDKSASISLSGANLIATRDAGTTHVSVRATQGRATGKYYFELHSLSGGDTIVGVAASTLSLSSYAGGDAASYGYYRVNGQKLYAAAGSAFGATWSNGDKIGVAVDLDAGKLWFSKNGAWQGSGDPAAGTSPAFSGLAGTYFPVLSLYAAPAVAEGRFKVTDFTYPPPSGFSAWGGSAPSGGCVFDTRAGGAAGLGLYSLNPADGNKWGIKTNAGVTTSGSVLTADVWAHLAVSKQGTTVRGFKDGALEFTYTDSRTYALTALATVGANGSVAEFYKGYLDEMRVTKGEALYTSAFSPPIAAFPNPALASDYAAVVLADAPIAYYRLNETSGTTAADSSGYGRNGTYASADMTLGVAGLLTGSSDKAAYFNPAADASQVNCNFNNDLTLGCTLEAIVNIDASQPDDTSTIITKRQYYASDFVEFPISLAYHKADGTLRFSLDGGTNFVSDLVLTTAVSTGVVYHIVGVYRPNGVCELWVNNSRVAFASFTGGISSNARNWLIGASHGYTGGAGLHRFKGTIDEAAIYSAPLGATRIAEHYAAFAGLPSPGGGGGGGGTPALVTRAYGFVS